MNHTNSRSIGLDVWRVVAIVAVFCFHAPRADVGEWAKFGWMGVDLFFVLSGYLIGRQILARLSENRFSFKTFYVSRFLRTLPAYLVVLAAYFAIPWFRERPELPPLWTFLTFTQNFGLTRSAFSHAWSLCIEEQFYLIAPLALALVFRSRVKVIAAVGLVLLGGVVCRHFAWQAFDKVATKETRWDLYLTMLYYPTWGRLDGLAFGVLLAAARLRFSMLAVASPAETQSLDGGEPRDWRWFAFESPWPSLILGAALVDSAIKLFTDRLSYSASLYGYPLLSLGFMLLVNASLARSTPAPRSFVARSFAKAISMVAILSYSFYLMHKQVMHWLSGQPAAVLFAASLLTAYIMYEAIERPFLKLRRRILAKPVTR